MANTAVNAAERNAERPSLTLTLTRRLRARPEKVFAAWTQAGQLMQWFGPPNMKPANSFDRNFTELGKRSPLKRSKSPW